MRWTAATAASVAGGAGEVQESAGRAAASESDATNSDVSPASVYGAGKADDSGQCSDGRQGARTGEAADPVMLQHWTEAILIAAAELQVAASPEQTRNACDWAMGLAANAALPDIALAAGLQGVLVEAAVASLSPMLLPAIAPIGARYAGVITHIGADVVTMVVPMGGQAVARHVPLAEFRALGPQRLLLLQPRRAARQTRLDQLLIERPKSWLRGVFDSNWRILLDLGMGSLCGNLLAIATSLFAMQVWDRVVPARSLNTLWVLASGVAIALALELLIRTLRVALTDSFGKQADIRLSTMFFARVLDIRNDARPRSPGTLIAQLRELEQVRELLTSSTLGVLLDLPFVLVFLFIIWLLGGALALAPLAAVPLIVIPGLLLQFPLAQLANAGMEESALRNAVLMESIYRAEDIKLLQAEPRFRQIWTATNRKTGDISLRQRFIAGVLVNYAATVQQLAYASVIVGGVYGILDGALSFGAVLACSILTSRTIAPLGQIAGVLGRVQGARVGKKALDRLLVLPVDHEPGRDAYHRPRLRGAYQFENVVYAYGTDDAPALTVPMLRIEPGERIAILGRAGAGKSTLLRLLAGMATPVNGRILLDGAAMGVLDVADVRRDIGLLLQDSSLFYGTLRDNLCLGCPTASDEQMLAAMRLACADSLLLNQPNGLDLHLRESGAGLSGGQRQALLLARLLLRSPQVLLLDEPTAALDETTERAIINQLKGWLGDRTLVVATHRYQLLDLVDRIIVVDGGRIAMNGPKDEVIRTLSGAATRAPASPPAPVAATSRMGARP